MIYTEGFAIDFRPIANPDAIVAGPGYRISVLTSRLLRLEYSPTGEFEDRPSQAFWYREQPTPDLRVLKERDRVVIDTGELRIDYTPDDNGFSPETLSIEVKALGVTWRYGDADSDNLGGTARTLDEADGPVTLERGLLSRSGWAVVDDTSSLVFDKNGWLWPREAPDGYRDLYFFGYGHDFHACLRDYYRVSGQVPLLPRWVLGNWWSRYWPYTADELFGLMREFEAHQVPLAVCIVDMDWHITDTGNRSSGWTGYTWNRDLFPDPTTFVRALHELGLKTALNLHPALGVYPHEEQYAAMARRMGIDPSTEEPVPFDIADPEFTRAYFELLHHPYEEMGIDFWWLDWQQGTESTVQGLDPLWWLNHLHFYDLARNGDKRSFIFSRWGGLGNHRYPIGFSGDTVVSWDSLSFQPYFTATAANVGYGWWSHDIGGHMGGIEDAELYARWVQYGVFSPILRLHCTRNPYHERRPWGYDAETLRVTRQAMQLRHALIPYLFTLSWQNHVESRMPIRPMYHDYPELEPAYHCPDQYTFGHDLIVAPIVSPADSETRLGRQIVWLPPGQWFSLFEGLSYEGDGWHAIYGGLEDIPVFARAGTILPLAPLTGWGGVAIPDALEVHIFPGADGDFELYEDGGGSGHSLIPFKQTWQERELSFEIGAAIGVVTHLPTQRDYTLKFRNLIPADIAVRRDGVPCDCAVAYDADEATLSAGPVSVAPGETLEITVRAYGETLLAERDHRWHDCMKLLRACRLNTELKRQLNARLSDILADPSILRDYELVLGERLARALFEIITGAGVHKAKNRRDGNDQIILWNNSASPAVTYKFVAVPLVGWLAVRKRGPLPRFMSIRQGEDRLELLSGGPVTQEMSVTRWLRSLPERFLPQVAGGFDATIQFSFPGEEGAEAHIRVAQGSLTLVYGQCDNPDLYVEADPASWLSLVNGQVSPEDLFLSGKLQVSGDMTLAMRLADVIGGTAEQTRFRSAPWRLEVNYLDALRLEWKRSE